MFRNYASNHWQYQLWSQLWLWQLFCWHRSWWNQTNHHHRVAQACCKLPRPKNNPNWVSKPWHQQPVQYMKLHEFAVQRNAASVVQYNPVQHNSVQSSVYWGRWARPEGHHFCEQFPHLLEIVVLLWCLLCEDSDFDVSWVFGHFVWFVNESLIGGPRTIKYAFEISNGEPGETLAIWTSGLEGQGRGLLRFICVLKPLQAMMSPRTTLTWSPRLTRTLTRAPSLTPRLMSRRTTRWCCRTRGSSRRMHLAARARVVAAATTVTRSPSRLQQAHFPGLSPIEHNRIEYNMIQYHTM